jgi:hypothetical protein
LVVAAVAVVVVVFSRLAVIKHRTGDAILAAAAEATLGIGFGYTGVNALHVHTFFVVSILTRAGGDPVQRLLGQPTAAVVAARISDPAAL